MEFCCLHFIDTHTVLLRNWTSINSKTKTYFGIATAPTEYFFSFFYPCFIINATLRYYVPTDEVPYCTHCQLANHLSYINVACTNWWLRCTIQVTLMLHVLTGQEDMIFLKARKPIVFYHWEVRVCVSLF